MTMPEESRKVVIVGAGPAGLTAAVYAARANLKPLVIEGVRAGGQLMLTTEVENYPGFVDGIMGPELMDRMRKQAVRFEADFVTEDAVSVDLATEPFEVRTADRLVTTDAVIVATGAVARMLEVPGEEKLLGHGVSTCATCDGFFFRGKELLVVGGGDTALEEAIFLTKFASKVTVVHRRSSLRASKIMQDRALANPKIAWRWDTVVEEILGDGSVSGARMRNTASGEVGEERADGVFVAIGHEPQTALFKGQLEMDDVGYIKVQGETTETTVPGVFAAGDVVDHRYRQAITAAGMGCMAAIDAERYLEGRPITEHAW
jgi:thioredoxin reductase (NADPH)